MPISPARQRAIDNVAYMVHCQHEADRISFPMTMTDATQAIWGTSGRGNPNAVRIIEACAAFGYLRIEKVGKVKRIVHLTAAGAALPFLDHITHPE